MAGLRVFCLEGNGPSGAYKLHQGPVRPKEAESIVTRGCLVLLVWLWELAWRGSRAGLELRSGPSRAIIARGSAVQEDMITQRSCSKSKKFPDSPYLFVISVAFVALNCASGAHATFHGAGGE